ncbi:cell division protease FtsH [Limimonas halophila]|uniref:ATP-dependent zinc metalloprotease FtsH n=1 Tax=Limimonas halophila TaxID=1082479 RepID=A0A1G7LSX3_9PROT|nr:ATP-dependent zinc metalloprotease FtsH [Limimonas halophila]SDF52511.1 cell division protease FtsH [Limimonas halophila]
MAGGTNDPNDEQARKQRWHLGYLAAALFAVFIVQYIYVETTQVADIPYSAFEEYLDQGRIESVRVGSETITGTFTEPVDGKQRFTTRRVEGDVLETLRQHGVEYNGQVENTFLQQILSWVIPIALLLGVWYFVFRRVIERQAGGGLMQIGKSKARVYYEKKTRTTFDEVAGIDEVKEELEEVVEFLREPERYGRLGAKVPKGVLLAGPPGTGKTLIARAVAGEAEVPFFYINGSEFVEMFVGVGAARVRDLFNQAKEKAPAIIFIDELDALGRVRGGGGSMGGGGHDEKEQTLNQLLVEMDGFDPTSGLVLIGATNRPEILDPALLRAGRFDRRVIVDRPDKKGRAAILRVHAQKVVLGEDVDIERLAELTPGFTGADLENLVNEAALLATRRDGRAVTMSDFTNAIERVVAGLQKKNRVLSDEERRRVAYHELGHALMTLVLPGVDPVQKISIIPRSVGALGYTMQRPTGDRYLMTRAELTNKMCVLLGGRAAENVFFDDVSTGASDDLEKCTDVARSMVTQYGMTDALGQVTYERKRQSVGGLPMPQESGPSYAEATAREIDATVRTLVDDAFDRTLAYVRSHKDELDTAAQRLLQDETMDEPTLRSFFSLPETGDTDRAPRAAE